MDHAPFAASSPLNVFGSYQEYVAVRVIKIARVPCSVSPIRSPCGRGNFFHCLPSQTLSHSARANRFPTTFFSRKSASLPDRASRLCHNHESLRAALHLFRSEGALLGLDCYVDLAAATAESWFISSSLAGFMITAMSCEASPLKSPAE